MIARGRFIFLQLFYFILFQIKILIKLLYEICYLFHQIIVLSHLFLKTACMLYISLPVLLTVKSLVFNFLTVPSSTHDFYIKCPKRYLVLIFDSIRRYNDRKTGNFSSDSFLLSAHFFFLCDKAFLLLYLIAKKVA